MNTTLLTEIEQRAKQLSPDEKLWLIERLIRELRKNVRGEQTSLEHELAAMAADPDIQRELQAINAEFAATESDGLV